MQSSSCFSGASALEEEQKGRLEKEEAAELSVQSMEGGSTEKAVGAGALGTEMCVDGSNSSKLMRKQLRWLRSSNHPMKAAIAFGSPITNVQKSA